MPERIAHWLRKHVADPLQLALGWQATEPVVRAPERITTPTDRVPRPASGSPAHVALLDRLRAMGLGGIEQLTLRRTRTVMVSARHGRLSLHADFAHAPDDVLRAVVRFLMSRRRADRLAAQRIVLAYEVSRPPARRRLSPPRPTDAPLLERLRLAHASLNRDRFGGTLASIPIAISGRMKTRLGQYTPVQDGVEQAEIAIGRRHLRRDPWTDVLHTLLHEMVHQWQDESGHPVDHGVAFRRKAREVGVLPRAKRPLARARDASPSTSRP
jgi:hypothetical protein